MSAVELRPPLPPPLSHDGITFVMPKILSASPPEAVISAIAAALASMLPPGDFAASADGRLVFHASGAESLWYQAGLLQAMERASER